MKQWILGASLALVSTLGQAYSFDFTARITYSDQSLAGVSVGTAFSGHMEGLGAGDFYQLGDKVGHYSFSQGQVTAQIGAYQISSSRPQLEVWDNWGGNVEDAFTMSSGDSLQVGQTTYRNGTISFRLTSRPGNTGVIQSLALPGQIDVAAFDGHPSLTYGELRRDDSSNGTLLGFTVTSVNVTPVPEPESILLSFAGALVAGVLARRKRLPD